jgi:hypothetical protein
MTVSEFNFKELKDKGKTKKARWEGAGFLTVNSKIT